MYAIYYDFQLNLELHFYQNLTNFLQFPHGTLGVYEVYLGSPIKVIKTP